MEKLEKLEGRITKILDSKMDDFVELGMDDGGSIYVEKGVFTHQFKSGNTGKFTYHRALWGKNKREVRILDGYVPPAPVAPPQKAEPQPIQPPITGQNIQIQEIKNQDCIEVSISVGKADGRKEQMIRVFGDLSKPDQMKAKLANAKTLIEQSGM